MDFVVPASRGVYGHRVKYFLDNGWSVDDTRGGRLCIVHSLLSSSAFLFQTSFVPCFNVILSSQQHGDVCGGLRSARDARSAQWETSIEPRGGLWLRFHPARLRCSSIHLWLQLLRAACAYITVALHSRRVGHARFLFRLFGGSA